LLKTFFFCHTGRGGVGNHGTSMKSKIIPIARWLSRCVLWLMGYDYNMVLDELLHVPQQQYNDDDAHSESSSDDESTASGNDDFSDDIDDVMTI